MIEVQTECGRECVIEREEVLMSQTCVHENTVSSWTVLITANEVRLLLFADSLRQTDERRLCDT